MRRCRLCDTYWLAGNADSQREASFVWAQHGNTSGNTADSAAAALPLALPAPDRDATVDPESSSCSGGRAGAPVAAMAVAAASAALPVLRRAAGNTLPKEIEPATGDTTCCNTIPQLDQAVTHHVGSVLQPALR